MQDAVKLSEKCFGEFLKLTYELTGITIASNRTSMIEGRLRKRVSELGLGSYEEYLKKVREDGSEQTAFIDLITTNETHFFRTPRIWEFIEKKFLPDWHRNHPKQVFTAWSAAASSGEEANSLGILFQSFKDKNPSFRFQILGTDISQEMVALCREGKFAGKSVEEFKKTRPELFQKYMKPLPDGGFQADQEIRSRIRFEKHNLLKALPAKDRFDLILVRNVLIYFKAPEQEKVLLEISRRLGENGVVVIGESESLSYIKTPFKLVEPLVYGMTEGSLSSPRAA